MTSPAVSVVMPVRDAAPTLGAALDSIRAQTMTDWELVVVDDGSLDDTGAFVSALAKRDARIRVAVAPYPGIVHALTAGLAAARAPLIARMDADDVALPERLARQRGHLEARPSVGLVASRVLFEGDAVLGAGYARHVDWTNTLLTHDQIRLGAFVESPFAHPSVMFRRALVEGLGGYVHADGPEDYELWLRWLDAGVRMEKLPETLLRWRDSPRRLSRVDPRYDAQAFDRVRARYLARWLAEHNPHHPGVVVWGAGRTSRRRARALAAHGVIVNGWIDIDPRKIGRRPGQTPVVAPGELPPPGRCFVVSYVGSHDARDLIDARLRGLGYRAGEHYLLAA
ncbi:MAG: glycosyltransferase [Candidatus Rokubacteria bacterium]|nr:glycosyltransferase [Candidatus Rokubacteria bacterium]